MLFARQNLREKQEMSDPGGGQEEFFCYGPIITAKPKLPSIVKAIAATIPRYVSLTCNEVNFTGGGNVRFGFVCTAVSAFSFFVGDFLLFAIMSANC